MRLISAIHVSAALLWTVCAIPIPGQNDTPSSTTAGSPIPIPSISSLGTNSDVFTTPASLTQTAESAQATDTDVEPSEGSSGAAGPIDHQLPEGCIIS
ncbi:hypothetical protein DFH06DRAFT_1213845 [Mycena polygramma]|nr:hypothetical protein DFH06DRAFT_1213845 [Mycena polygramma]